MRQQLRLVGCVWGILLVAPAIASDDVLDRSLATSDPGDATLWYDIRHLGVEGRGWSDTKAPFDRLPARAEGVVRDAVWGLSRHSAGLCVRFVTDATTIKARWTLTSERLAMPHMPATGVSGLDLYVCDDSGRWTWLGVGQPTKQTNVAQLAGGIPAGRREYLLYLPLYNGVSSVELGIAKENSLAKAPARPAGQEKPIVFYGTSITQGGCASRPGMVHTAILGRRLHRPVINLGFSGNGKMEPEVVRLLAELDAAAYVIDCLPNMTAAEVAERTEPLVHMLRESRPDTPIVLVEDRSYANAHLITGMRERNASSRVALRAANDKLLAAGVERLVYLRGDRLLGADCEDTVDGSHPTDLGFVRQADAFEPVLAAVLERTSLARVNKGAAEKQGAGDDSIPKVTERARRLHDSAILIDGHNDLPWIVRTKAAFSFDRHEIARRLDHDHTDVPRLREGGVKGQFWSVYVPADLAKKGGAARATMEQIDVVYRMVQKYADTFEMAYSADDIERIAKSGKIASLVGIEGGHSIENSIGTLRMFHRLGARYMTLTHSDNLDWADSATDEPRHGGLTPFGEAVVREMNRLGMLVDISHVSADTMRHVLRVAEAPVIASHSSAYAIAPHPRNVPDDVLKLVAQNGGVIMVNFFSGFVDPEAAKMLNENRQVYRELREKSRTDAEFQKALDDWRKSHKLPRGTLGQVLNHIDHIVKVAGVDHVGIGSDFDGINSAPVGLEDVSTYPRITQGLLDRGYSDADIRKILGDNLLRAFRRAGDVATRLQHERPESLETLRKVPAN
jgi:membrane dipeptidase